MDFLSLHRMKRELRIRFVSLMLALTLVAPMAVGLVHALHEHENAVCVAENESHVHKQGIDCDHKHFFSPGYIFIPSFVRDAHITYHSTSDALMPPSGASVSDPLVHQLRGPPVVNV